MFLLEGNMFHKKCNWRVSVGKFYPDIEILSHKGIYKKGQKIYIYMSYIVRKEFLIHFQDHKS